MVKPKTTTTKEKTLESFRSQVHKVNDVDDDDVIMEKSKRKK